MTPPSGFERQIAPDDRFVSGQDMDIRYRVKQYFVES